jgi:hypothetical protein
MKRSEVVRSVADLARELGHSPSLEMIAARLGQGHATMEAALKALVAERSLEAVDGSYRVLRFPSSSRIEAQAEPTTQPELFAQTESEDPPDRLTAEELAAIAESALEESGGDENATREISRSPMAEPESKAGGDERPPQTESAQRESQPRRQAPSPSRQPRPKAQRAAPGLSLAGQWQIAAIRVTMAAAGIGAAIVSGYFMILKLSQVMPFLLAVLLGSIMVCFSVLAFETVIVFIRRQEKAIASLFIGAWLVIWVFTLLACVSGFFSFYGSLLTKTTEASAPEQANRRQLELIRDRQSDLQSNIAEKRKEIADLENILSRISDSMEDRQKYANEYTNAQGRLLSRENQLQELQDGLQKARDQEATLIASTPPILAEKRSTDFYVWLSSITRIKADTLELVASMVPALLIDLMASGGIAIALFL